MTTQIDYDYRPIWRDAYNIQQKYTAQIGSVDPVEMWEKYHADVTNIAWKFDNDPFLIDILMAITSQLERMWETNGRTTPTT